MKKIQLLLLLIVNLSCSTQKNKMTTMNNDSNDYEIILTENYGGFPQEKTILVNNKKALNQVYMQLNMMRKPGIPIPTIDFENHTVIAVFFGKRNKGGNKFEIQKIQQKETQINITIKETKPEIASMAITHPSMFIKIPKIKAKTVSILLKKE